MSAEVATNACRWDKRSTWKSLTKKVSITSWFTILKRDYNETHYNIDTHQKSN